MTPFITESLRQKPMFTSVLTHREFICALRQLNAIGRLRPQATIVIVTGPSNAGKSMLLRCFAEFLLNEVFPCVDKNFRPVIGASAQTSRDGRTTPKYMLSELLADLGSPLHDLQKLMSVGYAAGRYLDETAYLRLLRHGMIACGTEYVLIDEGNFLVRTKDPLYKSSLVESLKGLVSSVTTLVLFGGYELLQAALTHRSHLASRKIVINLGRYKENPDDLSEWRGIIQRMSASPLLSLSDPNLLIDKARPLLVECHGVIGILEKRLIRCIAMAESQGSSITDEIIAATEPTQDEWDTIRNDIASGEKALRPRMREGATNRRPVPDSPQSGGKPKKKRGLADRAPKRCRMATEVESP